MRAMSPPASTPPDALQSVRPGTNATRATATRRLREAMELVDELARKVARQLGHRVHEDDLRGHAHEAVVGLLDRYDETRGVSFRAFARLRIRGAMFDGLRKDATLPRSVNDALRALTAMDAYAGEQQSDLAVVRATTAAEADARLAKFFRGLSTAYASGLAARTPDGVAAGDGDDASEASHASGGAASEPTASGLDPEAEIARRQLRARILQALDEIGEPDGTILRRHYFLDEDLNDAAAHVGLSKSWGSRVHARGIDRLGARLLELRGEL